MAPGRGGSGAPAKHATELLEEDHGRGHGGSKSLWTGWDMAFGSSRHGAKLTATKPPVIKQQATLEGLMEGWLATALCLGRRGVTLPPQLWEKIQGFEDDYPDDEAWVLGPGRGCCQEGLYVVKPVGALVPGVPGEGVDHLEVLFVGLVGVPRNWAHREVRVRVGRPGSGTHRPRPATSCRASWRTWCGRAGTTSGSSPRGSAAR